MRIIAGEFRGRRLCAPKGRGTRPTTDRVRESLMSAITSARGGFDGATVLDAFAGSGALGLEALSRGASCAHFCEHDGAALAALAENVATLRLDAQRARVHRGDVLKNPPCRVRPAFDLVFLDPPYALAAEEVFGLLERLFAAGALDADVLAVYEHDVASDTAADAVAQKAGWSVVRRRRFGDTAVDLLRRTASSSESDSAMYDGLDDGKEA